MDGGRSNEHRPSRRALLAAGAGVVGAVATAGCTFGGGAILPARADRRLDGAWTQPGGDAANTRSIGATGLDGAPRVRWSRSLRGFVTAEPTVADSLVYVTAGSDGRYPILEAAVGDPYLTHDATDLTVLEGLSVVDGYAYAQSVENDRTGPLVRLDAPTFDRGWTADLRGLGLVGTTVLDDAVYAYSGGRGGHYVQALDAEDGTERWHYETLALPGPVAATDRLVAVAAGRYLFGLDPTSGERSWIADFGRSAQVGAVAIADGAAFAAGGDRIRAVDRTGTDRWTATPGSGEAVSSLAVADGVVYAGTAGGVVALGTDRGRRRWRRDLPSGVDSVTAAGELVYATTADAVVALGSADGRVRWRHEFEGTIRTPPAAIPDLLVVVTVGDGAGTGGPEVTVRGLG